MVGDLGVPPSALGRAAALPVFRVLVLLRGDGNDRSRLTTFPGAETAKECYHPSRTATSRTVLAEPIPCLRTPESYRFRGAGVWRGAGRELRWAKPSKGKGASRFTGRTGTRQRGTAGNLRVDRDVYRGRRRDVQRCSCGSCGAGLTGRQPYRERRADAKDACRNAWWVGT
jgi:hypothetical protein